MKKIIFLTLFLFIIGIDIYIYNKTKIFFNKNKKYIYNYWFISSILWINVILTRIIGLENIAINKILMPIFFLFYMSKLLGSLFLFIVDIIFLIQKKSKKITQVHQKGREKFLAQTGMLVTTIPMATMGIGIISGAHNYTIRRVALLLPDLPKGFHDITIAHISDIHSGSFFNKGAVQRGISMLLEAKPTIIFFTGDLVNNRASEMKDYITSFQKIKAPLGVFSVLGNHDYGDYVYWSSPEAKKRNFHQLCQIHNTLGWKLLKNTHHILTINKESIAIIGVENWGDGKFSKYGNLQKAYQGTGNISTKILLSHDPSHWDAEVNKKFQDIVLTLAGHTHGFQFGIEIGNIRWSPAQYRYKQWAGLYQNGKQYLYVNRGFGYIGYPGRIGIWPEITIINLKRGI